MNRKNEFKSFQKVLDLNGHKDSVNYINCSEENDKAITISKDNSLKIWNLNIRRDILEQPKIVKSIDLKENKLNLKNVNSCAIYTDIEKKKSYVAVNSNSNVIIFDFETENIVENIEEAISENDEIVSLRFSKIKNEVYLFVEGNEEERINVFKINFKN